MSNRIYTKDPTVLLAPGERPMYDAMLEHSKILKIAATNGVKEILELIPAVRDAPDEESKTAAAQEVYYGMHRLLTYCFTQGASFAFAQIAKSMGPAIKQEQAMVDNIIELDKQRKTDS